MKKKDIKVGGKYIAKVSGNETTVRVDAIREIEGWNGGSIYSRQTKASTRYDVTNLRTGRKTTFRSAAKFRREVREVNLRCRGCGTGFPTQSDNYNAACPICGRSYFIPPTVSPDQLEAHETAYRQAAEETVKHDEREQLCSSDGTVLAEKNEDGLWNNV